MGEFINIARRIINTDLVFVDDVTGFLRFMIAIAGCELCARLRVNVWNILQP